MIHIPLKSLEFVADFNKAVLCLFFFIRKLLFFAVLFSSLHLALSVVEQALIMKLDIRVVSSGDNGCHIQFGAEQFSAKPPICAPSRRVEASNYFLTGGQYRN